MSMIRVKIVKENKEAVNELFGIGTTGKSKSAKPADELKLYSQLTQIEDKMDKKKLKDLGLSLTDLMHLVEQTLGVASGKIGSLQTMSMSKVQALINLLSEEYKDILEKHKAKKISVIEANNLITGIAKIANFAKAHSISKFAESKGLQEQEKIEEILGMQNKALDKFIQSLKPVGSGEGPTSLSGEEDKKEVPQQKTAAVTPPAPPPEAKTVAPPPPPEDNSVSDAVQAAIEELPQPVKYSASNRTGLMPYYNVIRNTQGYPEDISATEFANIVSAMGGTDVLSEQLDLNNIATTSKVSLEKVKKLVDFMQKNDLLKKIKQEPTDVYEDEFRKKYPDVPLDRIPTGKQRQVTLPDGKKIFVKGGKRMDETLKENLIARKNNSLSEQQVKRFKLLAGLL
jgi:hypothetical protein